MRLRTNQAQALLEAYLCDGLFAPLGVGEGKTLITLLLPYVMEAKRPLLLLPANLIEKTNRDRVTLARHWLIPNHTRLMSVEILGRVQSAAELDIYQPDLIIVDEAHKLKNRRAACTRRVARYMAAHPQTQFCALTGTIMGKSLTEFAHLLLWALKEGAPIPHAQHEIDEWASVLDLERSRGEEWHDIDPGPLLTLCNPSELREAPERAARLGFQRRLTDTPGVVASHIDGEFVGASIHVSALRYGVQPITEQHFRRLRGAWETPDGWPLSSGVDVWRHARELSLGLHYVWDPRPPQEWLNRRREWAAFVREVLAHSRSLDSELQVAQAVTAGKIDDRGVLRAWQEIRDAFEPNTVPVWHDDSALRVCADWAQRQPGIVWTEHSFFAERLSRETHIPYYGAKGMTAAGAFIDDANPTMSAIVSIDANREGRNLQAKWSRNLIVSPPENSAVWQQVIGRTHRPGQLADEVTVEVFLGCAEHARAFTKALAGAQAVKDTTGAEQKLLLADIEWPSEGDIARFAGARWTK